MKSKPETHRLEDLAKSYSERHLAVNPEYQRGATWNLRQQRALVDSILRGFILPIFYVHLVRTQNLFTGTDTVAAWLVDGQQRLNAITEFMRGRFALSDPTVNPSGLRMAYEQLDPPRWAGKHFDELYPDDRASFLNHPLQVVLMEEETQNEVRDLFIRLQSGTPLNPQEKRDAWPGNFTLFVIKHAGKDGHPHSAPHSFFNLVKQVGPRSEGDESVYIDRRSNTRKFFAGLAMTYLVRQESQVDFVDLKAANIDAFYLNKASLPAGEPNAAKLLEVLTQAASLPEIHRIRDGNKLKFQWAFHFALLVDSMLRGEYVDASWRGRLVDSFEKFREDCTQGSRAFKQGQRTRHYTEFVQPLSGSGSDTAEIIRRRHQFLLQEIIRAVQPRPRDPQRTFGEIEREIMWYRQSGCCAHPECKKPTALCDMHGHHIREHSQGGATTLENGVLICRTCHRDRREMQSLEDHFLDLIGSSGGEEPIQDETELTATPGTQKVRIQIDWPALMKGETVEVIHRSVDTDTIVEFCERLIEVFEDEAIGWMTSRPMIRFPVSRTPNESFRNPVTGAIYSHREIANTGLHVCTLSSQTEKLRRIQTWIAELPEPIDEAITVSLEPLRHK